MEGKNGSDGKRTPMYMRIAEDLREEMRTGALQPDDPVPSAAMLCERYSVSMITAKNALNLLRGEGFTYSVPGKGTYVAERQRMIRTAPQRYFRSAERTYVDEAQRTGRRPEVEHSTTLIAADSWISQRLDIELGAQVVCTTYFVKADGRPMSKSASWEPLAITGGTVIEHPHEGPHAKEGLNARFAAIGWAIEQVEEHLIIREPTSDEATDLAVPSGVPVVEVRQTVRAIRNGTDDLVPVEAADIVFPADRYEFHYLMDRPR